MRPKTTAAAAMAVALWCSYLAELSCFVSDPLSYLFDVFKSCICVIDERVATILHTMPSAIYAMATRYCGALCSLWNNFYTEPPQTLPPPSLSLSLFVSVLDMYALALAAYISFNKSFGTHWNSMATQIYAIPASTSKLITFSRISYAETITFRSLRYFSIFLPHSSRTSDSTIFIFDRIAVANSQCTHQTSRLTSVHSSLWAERWWASMTPCVCEWVCIPKPHCNMILLFSFISSGWRYGATMVRI